VRPTSPFVFISFASTEEALARKLRTALKRERIDVFCSTDDIAGGTNVRPHLASLIASRHCVFVPLYSREYAKDTHVSSQEFYSFVNKRGPKIRGRLAPIRLDNARVPPLAGDIQYLPISRHRFVREIRKIVTYIVASCGRFLSQSRPLSSATQHKVSQGYEVRLRKEFEEIVSRTTNQSNPRHSNSRIKIYGWLPTIEMGDFQADPAISYYDLKFQFELLASAALKRNTKSLSSKFCSFRYILYCNAVASGISTFNKRVLVGPILQGISKTGARMESIFIARQEIEALGRKKNANDILESYKKILLSMATALRAFDITINDLFLEETSPRRIGLHQDQRLKVEKDNEVTHCVEIYFKDQPKSYFNMMTKIDSLNYNLIKTVSEGLVPGRVAKATLWLNYKDNLERDLHDKMADDDNILGYGIREY
jgi:hypothetical protein